MASQDDSQAAVLVQLATIGGDVKAILRRLDEGDDRHKDHEARLRKLERLIWTAAGAAAAAGGVVGTALTRALGG